MFDLIIIGGSAAACTAAIYAGRAKLNFKMVTENLGGEMARSGKVGNWPGTVTTEGFELAQKFIEHVRSISIAIDEGWSIDDIIQKEDHYVVSAKNARGEEQKYETKAVLIATGIHPRQLNVPGEKELLNRGVTYCTVCDGPLFKDKITATIGAGNAALESVIMLSRLAKKVHLITRYKNTKENGFGFPRGEQVLIDKVKSAPNVEIIYGGGTTEILGKNKVEGVKYRDEAGQTQTLAADGVMVHIGMEPNSDIIDFVTKDNYQQIVIDDKCRTSAPGIFAAGDVTNVPFKQIVIAAGQGASAALAAIEYLNRRK